MLAPEVLSRFLQEGEQLFVVVDSPSLGSAYQLNASFTPLP